MLLWSFIGHHLGWWSVLLVVLSIAIATYVLKWINTRGKNPPPGPWGVPVLGYLPFLTRTPHVKLVHLAKTYGNVIGMNLIGNHCVVFNRYDAIKEVFLNRGLEFTGTPQKFSFMQWICGKISIFTSERDEWFQQRRFILQTMRDLGSGKNSLVDRIEHITQDLLNEFQSHNGAPFDPLSILYNCTVNVICSLLFNKHFQHDDPEFKVLIDGTRGMTTALEGVEFMLARGYLFYLSSAYRHMKSTKAILSELIRKLIQKHKAALNESYPQDYLDYCLIELKRGKASKPIHTEEVITGNCISLFLAGAETTTSSLYWFLNFMMMYPEVQKKVQNEMDEVVGRQRLPHWSDRSSLPYTEAVMKEMQRIASVVPMSVPKNNYEEEKFQGFDIPKRSTIIANLWAANRDPKYWPDPEKFDPSRFLDANGKLAARDVTVPFGIGKRMCVGESLARMEMFIFFTTILHQFSIIPPDGVTPSLNIRSTAIRAPFPYRLRAVPRA